MNNAAPKPIILDVVCTDCGTLDYRYVRPFETVICSDCGGNMVPVKDLEPIFLPANYVTMAWLNNKKACLMGKMWFQKNFPRGGSYDLVIEALVNNPSWQQWLRNNFDLRFPGA